MYWWQNTHVIALWKLLVERINFLAKGVNSDKNTFISVILSVLLCLLSLISLDVLVLSIMGNVFGLPPWTCDTKIKYLSLDKFLWSTII